MKRRILTLAIVAIALMATSVASSSASPATAGQAAPAATSVIPDPGDAGPLAVTSTEYNDGDTAFTPPGFGHAVEVRASVHYPTGLPGGPYPLIVLLHGRHSTCYSGGSATLTWPCTGAFQTIPSFQGYDYLATNLASWGYIVVSVSSNGINAFDNGASDLGATARAQLLQKHYDKWNTFNTTGGAPFGSTFVGKVNMQDIGIMGHSRGGEGVVKSYLLNQSLGSPYGIKAVLPLAPVDFNRPVIDGVPLDVILPYCDGDVSDLQGVHFYDDSRYDLPGDLAPKHTLLVMGANHNYFNTIWTPGGWPAGAADDWLFSGSGTAAQCGTTAPQRLTAAQQRSVGLAYMAGFFRRYLGNETALSPYFDGSNTQPASTGSIDLHAAYQAPDSPSTRKDVNRFLTSAALTTDQLGGAVTAAGLSPQDLCGGAAPQPAQCLSVSTTQQPHTVPSALSSKRGLSQLRTGWSAAGASMVNAIPAGQGDVSGYAALSFRIGLNFTDARNPAGSARDASIVLTDRGGGSHSEKISTWSDALYAPPGASSGLLPKLLLNTVRIPLSAFAGVNLSDVASVTLKADQSASAAPMMTDLAFVDSSGSPPALTVSVPNVSRNEGTGATPSKFKFVVKLSTASAVLVKVKLTTSDGTAVAPGDYTALTKILKFKPGTTTRPFTVSVIADSTVEPNETFNVDITSASGGGVTVADGHGVGTIVNDD